LLFDLSLLEQWRKVNTRLGSSQTLFGSKKQENNSQRKIESIPPLNFVLKFHQI